MKTDTISVGFCVYVACETTLSIEHTLIQEADEKIAIYEPIWVHKRVYVKSK